MVPLLRCRPGSVTHGCGAAALGSVAGMRRPTSATLAGSLLLATLAACVPPGGGGPGPSTCDAGEPFNDVYSAAVAVDDTGTFVSCNDQTDGGNDQDVFVFQLDDQGLWITCTSEGSESDFAVEYSATPADEPTDVTPTGIDEEPCNGAQRSLTNLGAGYYYLTVEHPSGSERATFDVLPAL